MPLSLPRIDALLFRCPLIFHYHEPLNFLYCSRPFKMSLLETISLEHVPATHSVHVAFFRDVSNAGFLQSQLLARNPDFEYAFIDATTIVSRLHVLAAVYKALSVLVDGKLKSPNVHAETVIALSASNNVRHSEPFPPRRS